MAAPIPVKVDAQSEVSVNDSCNCRCWPWQKEKKHKHRTNSTEIKATNIGQVTIQRSDTPGPDSYPNMNIGRRDLMELMKDTATREQARKIMAELDAIDKQRDLKNRD